VVRTGTAFAGGSGDHYDLYGYNDRNELTGSRRFAGATIPDPLPEGDGLVPSFAYGYDGIGNRSSMKACGVETCPPSGGETTTYTRNALNQYTQTSNPAESFTYDFDGNLTADGDADRRLRLVHAAAAGAARNPAAGSDAAADVSVPVRRLAGAGLRLERLPRRGGEVPRSELL